MKHDSLSYKYVYNKEGKLKIILEHLEIEGRNRREIYEEQRNKLNGNRVQGWERMWTCY